MNQRTSEPEIVPASIRVRPWRGPGPPARVLAIRLQALGDTVLTLPYLSALRRTLPGVSLDFLTRDEVSDIPKNIELFDRVHEIRGQRNSRQNLLSALALVPRLRAQRYHVVLDLQNNRISRLVRTLLNAPAWSEFDRLSPRLAGERTRATIEAAGLGPLEVSPDLRPRDNDSAVQKLRSAGWDGRSRLIVLNPAGSFPGRSWPLDAYVRFAELWLERESASTQFLVLALPSLAGKSGYLKQHLGDRLVDLTGSTTSFDAFLLCLRAVLVLSEDSGLMHIAWVAGAPTLGLFGASRSDWSRPHGNYSDVLRACQFAEGICVADGLCKAGPDACLNGLSSETVFERASKLVHDTADRIKRIEPVHSAP